jgi:hypothetical protein
MKMSKLVTAQLKYFNSKLNKDLTAEQIDVMLVDGPDYKSLDDLIKDIESTDFTTISSEHGICNELDKLTWLNIYTIIAKLSYFFYIDFADLSSITFEAYDGKLYYPIPSVKDYEDVVDKWKGLQLTRRLKYIKWLTRQFKLMSAELKSRQTA